MDTTTNSLSTDDAAAVDQDKKQFAFRVARNAANPDQFIEKIDETKLRIQVLAEKQFVAGNWYVLDIGPSNVMAACDNDMRKGLVNGMLELKIADVVAAEAAAAAEAPPAPAVTLEPVTTAPTEPPAPDTVWNPFGDGFWVKPNKAI